MDKIKKDQPDLSESYTSYINENKKPQEVLKDLEKVIEYKEDIRKRKLIL